VKTILVLDDEATLQRPLCRVLQLHGYRTLEASDGDEAIRRFHENDRAIDLLIADVSLPIGSGVQVAVLLREELPDLGVILASGYPAEAWKARDFSLLGRLGTESLSILQKPFAVQTLLATISKLIGEARCEVAAKA
jgi:two-component system cell cycle sensor histidine kinase/response regulator CckA